MKVIETPKPRYTAQVYCDPENYPRGCGAILEVTEEDLKVTWIPGSDKDWPWEGHIYTAEVTCPICKKEISIRGIDQTLLHLIHQQGKSA